jgi:hypothetical protein
MLNAIKMVAIAVVVAASASSAFAAVRSHADRGQSVESSAPYNSPTDRDSIVEQTGN